jgi:hypothetical protein
LFVLLRHPCGVAEADADGEVLGDGDGDGEAVRNGSSVTKGVSLGGAVGDAAGRADSRPHAEAASKKATEIRADRFRISISYQKSRAR